MKKNAAVAVIFLIFSFLTQCKKGADFTLKTSALPSAKKPPDPAKQETGYITFQTYGSVHPVGYVYEGMEITKEFGFEIKNLSGCDMTDSLSAAIKQNNLKSADLMEKKYGKNWIQDFEKKTGLHFSVPFVDEG